MLEAKSKAKGKKKEAARPQKWAKEERTEDKPGKSELQSEQMRSVSLPKPDYPCPFPLMIRTGTSSARGTTAILTKSVGCHPCHEYPFTVRGNRGGSMPKAHGPLFLCIPPTMQICRWVTANKVRSYKIYVTLPKKKIIRLNSITKLKAQSTIPVATKACSSPAMSRGTVT